MALYAYAAALTDNSLTILDVTDPTAPVFKSNIAGNGSPNYLGLITGLNKVGNYCYCGCAGTGIGLPGGDACLTIIDVSNPAAPAFVSTLPVGSSTKSRKNIRRVFMVGNYCYMADSNSGLYIVDVSNPLLPSIVGSILFPALGLTAAAMLIGPYVYGSYAYLGYLDASLTPVGLIIVDISNPAAPTFKGTLQDQTHFGQLGPFPSGNYCYAGGGQSLFGKNALNIIDISNPAAPTWLSWITGADAPNFLKGCVGVFLESPYCYCSTEQGLTIIDISNPAVPTFVSNFSLGAITSFSIYKDGAYLYCASGIDATVYIVDVSTPATPSLSGSISGAGSPNFLGYVGTVLTGSFPGPTPTPYQSPPCIIDFKGILDCIKLV